MYVISLASDGSIHGVYDTEVYVDEGVETFPITPEEKDLIWKSGNNFLWAYQNGVVVQHAENYVAFLGNEVRQQRDRLLAETDWTQAADVPQATKDKWAPYRQALRDITEQAGFPMNVTWPTKPE